MKTNTKIYLQLLADDKNLIIYSNDSINAYAEIFDKFHTFTTMTISDYTINNISSTLIENRIDIVIVFDCANAQKNKQLITNIKAYNSNIDIIFIAKQISPELTQDLNGVDSVLFSPVSLDHLWRACFGVLSSLYTLKNIANTEKSITKIQKPINKDDFEEFLDTWEGKIMFLSQDIDELVSKLDSGELSNELILECAKKIDEVEEIFRTRSYTKKIAPIFSEFSGYLKFLKVEAIDSKNIEGFEYLARIMEDINVYIVEYFVDRIFKDVYVFQDSLLSNINFMENKLVGSTEDNSELHFF